MKSAMDDTAARSIPRLPNLYCHGVTTMYSKPTQPAVQLRSACERWTGPWAYLSRCDNIETSLAPMPGQSPDGSGEVEGELPTEANDLGRLEAVLFLAREPLSSRKLSQYANLADGTQARTLIRRLNERYDAAGRAFRVEQIAGGYQLLTRRKLHPWLRRLAHIPVETRLSAPALETLAVIAYRQPVPRADIESIRGVNCGEILRQLMDRDLVRIGGRSNELGRPYLYATTKRFLQVFGLNQTTDLPDRESLRSRPPPAVARLSPGAEGFAASGNLDGPASLNGGDEPEYNNRADRDRIDAKGSGGE